MLGRPVVFGQNNYLFGHHDQTINGTNLISIGTNTDHDIQGEDDQIILYSGDLKFCRMIILLQTCRPMREL